MLRREHEERRAEQRVRARREDREVDRRLAGSWNTTSAPSERPIQLRCMVITRCGHDSSSLKSSSRRSA